MPVRVCDECYSKLHGAQNTKETEVCAFVQYKEVNIFMATFHFTRMGLFLLANLCSKGVRCIMYIYYILKMTTIAIYFCLCQYFAIHYASTSFLFTNMECLVQSCHCVVLTTAKF